MVIANKEAATKFEKINKDITETKDIIDPKINACFLVNLPVGIGLKQVLDITESKSASYHMFSAPAAPDPSATAMIERIALYKLICPGAIINPTTQVKTASDITLGFIKSNKAFR